MKKKDLDPRLVACREEISQVLSRDDYDAAEDLMVRAVEELGVEAARWVYPLAWERAMAQGRGRLRAYFVTEQASWDPENLAGEALRQSQLSLVDAKIPQRDVPPSRRALSQLSQSPALSPNWAAWEEAIRLVHDYLCSVGPVPDSGGLVPQSEPRSRPSILTGGSGRSGSSAIFDWLAGYVAVTGIRHQHFHLRDAMFSVTAERHSRDYRKRVVEMLWGTFLGRMIYTSKSQNRRVALARSLNAGQRSTATAQACLNIMRSLCSDGHANGTGSYQAVLDNVASLFAPPETQFAGSGWLDFDAAHLYVHLPNTHIICSVRDPRDIYTEHCRLTRTFNRDVGKFIEDYRARMKSLEAAQAQNDLRNVIVTQFETFTRSEQERRHIADKVGVNHDGERRASMRFPFDPQKSAQNIGVHRDFEDQRAIGQIREALSTYCVSA